MENTTVFFDNITALLVPWPPKPSTTTRATGIIDTFYIALFLLYVPGILTNAICMFLLTSETKKSKLPTNTLLLLLCSTDFVAVSLSCFWSVTKRLGMTMGYNLCAVKCFLHPMMPLLTGAVSLLMALDRVLAFCKPFYYRTHISKKMWIICYIMAIIVLSVVCVLPHIGLGSFWTPKYKKGKVSYTCSVFTYQTEERKKISHLIYMFLGLLLVAGIIISNIVVAGAVLLLRNRTIEAQKSRSNQPAVSRSTEIKFAIIVGALACVFVTCWLPYNVSHILFYIYCSITYLSGQQFCLRNCILVSKHFCFVLLA